jgi:protein CpxP
MMKRFQRIAVSAAVVSLLAGGLPGYALAQGPGGPGRQGPGGARGARGALVVALRGGDLTDAQREQIRALTQQYRESGTAVREQLRQAQEAQRDALAAQPVNEGLVRSTTQPLADAQAEAAIVLARLRADVMALLTPDQLQAIEETQAEIQERTENRRERTEERRQRRGEQQQNP